MKEGRAILGAGIAYLEGEGRGLAGSLALHGVFAALALLFVLNRVAPPDRPAQLVPVDLCLL
jgi:hypothetical protein